MYTTVLTYGTFDLFHYGHSNVLKNASKLGSRLIVGVSSDQFNKAKGKQAYEPLATRLNNVSKLHFVTKAIVEDSWEQKISDIKRYNVSTFVIGDDWRGKFDFLKTYCDVLYLPRTPEISSTILREQLLTNRALAS